MKLRIATRKSPLAMKQAEMIKAQLIEHHPHLTIELVSIVTQGDVHLATPLATIGGKGLFTKELEEALLRNEADIAVHSLKDVTVEFPEGLALTTICEREDPRDVFIANNAASLAELPQKARIGTSSLRRQCLLKTLRPDVEVISLRGNVGTRLKKLAEDQFDAIILAAAGIKRLGLNQHIKAYFSPEEFLPAVGQGIIGIETRVDDEKTHQILAPLDHAATRICATAERAFNRALNGGCQVPIAGFAVLNAEQIYLRGFVGHPDGSKQISGEISGPLDQAEQLGQQLAKDLLNQGAGEILAMVYG